MYLVSVNMFTRNVTLFPHLMVCSKKRAFTKQGTDFCPYLMGVNHSKACARIPTRTCESNRQRGEDGSNHRPILLATP